MKLKQLMLPIMNESLCVDDILCHPEAMAVSCRVDLMDNLRKIHKIQLGLALPEEAKQSTLFTQTVDWSQRYSVQNRLDIVRRVIQVCTFNLADKIAKAYPNRQNLWMVSNLTCMACRLATKDVITLYVEISDEIHA